MKIKNLFLSGLACLAMTACSNNDEPTVVDNPFNGKSEAYIRLAITTPDNTKTRSDAFMDGSADENKINSVKCLFYDENGNYVTASEVTISNNGTAGNGSSTSTPSIENTIDATMILSNVTTKPTQVLTFVNANANEFTFNNLKNRALNDVLTEGLKDITQYATDHFLMSTVVYLSSDSKVITTTDISDKVYTSAEEAMENPACIYVERVAAKVEVKKSSEFSIDLPDDFKYSANANETGTAASLALTNLKWILNGTNKSSYIVKNIDESWTDTSLGITSWSNANISYTGHTTYGRSYWAKDMNYDNGTSTETYPQQVTSDVISSTTLPLAYTTFASATNMVEDNYTSQYCLENTNESIGNLYNETHVLLVGQLIINNISTPTSVVLYAGTFYPEDAFKNVILNQYYGSTGNKVYKKTTDGFASLTTSEVEVVQNLTQGASRVCLQLVQAEAAEGEEVEETTYYLAENIEAAASSTQTTNANGINELFAVAEYTGEGFKDGKMYYKVRIQHLGTTDSDGKETIGQYGIVRNHWYQLSIGKITGLGTAVWEPEQIIIPETTERYNVAAHLHVVNWRMVTQDNIEIK